MEKKKTKMGRPALKDKDKRNKLVTLRLKESDHKQLTKDAGSEDLSLSSYLIECWKKVRSR